MRQNLIILLGAVFLTTRAVGQEVSTLAIELTQTEVPAGEPFEVVFELENNNGGSFYPPDFESAGFTVVGTSQSSNITFNNGVGKSSQMYKYRVMARDTGNLEIPSARFTEGSRELITEPQTIHVLPNDAFFSPPQPSEDPMEKRRKELKKKIKTIHL